MDDLLYKKDENLLEQAWKLPVAAVYRKTGLEKQMNGAFCGPATAVSVLRSLDVTEFSQDNVLAAAPITADKVLKMGTTIDELAAVLAKKTGNPVLVIRDIEYEEFRQHLVRSNAPASRYIINFHRPSLSGDGSGHHSPIGAFMESENLVLVLDVNEAYGPVLVAADRLFASMDTIDRRTGRKRGLIRIELERCCK